jgi:tRNA dimethylallyltransferase
VAHLPPLAIVGPTAVGKTAVAERVARALGGEIVSADSMQVYRGMDIGTAKTPPAERLVVHHCIDLVEPGAPYSAALFQRDARAAIDALRSRGMLPVVAGGTGLYVRAALDDLQFATGELTSPLRTQLEREAAATTPEALHARLEATDPAAAALIHPHNVRRVIRALELAESGLSYADRAGGLARRESHYPGTRFVGLTMERAALYHHIDARVDAMMAAGLLAEVQHLLEGGYRVALTAAQAIGYKELVPVIEGAVALADAVAVIKQASRRYAKRQLTWFRADPRIVWLDVTGSTASEASARVIDLLESSPHPDEGSAA